MANQDEELFYYVGEVRTSSGESKGKLLFEMIVADQGLSILLKPKGDKKTYLIPLYLLIESFVNKTKDERIVFCKHFLDKIAKYFWTLLHVQIGQSCNDPTGCAANQPQAIADII